MRPGAKAPEALALAQLVRGHVANDLECRAKRSKRSLVHAAREEAVTLHAPDHILHAVAGALVHVVKAPLRPCQCAARGLLELVDQARGTNIAKVC